MDPADGARLFPLAILAVGIATVLALILVLRVNAFIALLTAAIVVSVLSPTDIAVKITSVADAFGKTAGSVGIVIAFASVIGATMMKSGAADRIVRAFTRLIGEERAPWVLLGSGYTLSIPVFFDTVFYLLVPLARSFYRRTRRHYLLCLLAIAGGGGLTHTLVPPTPGPLIVASTLGVDVGVMMVAGAIIGLPAAFVGIAYARWLDARMPVEMVEGPDEEAEPVPDDRLPGLGWSLAPVLLPVTLIASQTILQELAKSSASAAAVLPYAQVWGNPNLALLIAMAISVYVYWRSRRPPAEVLRHTVEEALMSGGLIILMTAAGGAFGGTLRAAGIAPAIGYAFGDVSAAGIGLLVLGFGICAVMKTAQGSTTTALIVTAGIVAAVVPEITPEALGYHPVYLATSIGGGGLVGMWMNDSGFWIFSRMGGLTEAQALRSLSTMTAVTGTTTFLVSVLGALVLPMV